MFIVDRIEGSIAVVEYNDVYLEIPLSSFNCVVSEGDVLTFIVDKEETEKRKSNIKSKLQKLFNK